MDSLLIVKKYLGNMAVPYCDFNNQKLMEVLANFYGSLIPKEVVEWNLSEFSSVLMKTGDKNYGKLSFLNSQLHFSLATISKRVE